MMHDVTIIALLSPVVWIVGNKIEATLNRNHADLIQQLKPLLCQFRLAVFESEFHSKEGPLSASEIEREDVARKWWVNDWNLNEFIPVVLPIAQHIARAVVAQQEGTKGERREA
jgi:hypothetical protein